MICSTCFGANPECPTCEGTGSIPDAPDPNRIAPRDLRKFGTAEFPLHASALPGLIECPWRAALVFLFTPTDESGEAADTGSATHVAVAAWHRNKDLVAAVREMRLVSEARFQKADLDTAAALFLLYARDGRNINAKIAEDKEGKPLLEYKVAFAIQASDEDQTQAPIQIVGTLDQVRIDDAGRKRVWDLKTSKRPGFELLSAHLYQQAAYAIAASAAVGEMVNMGGLICPRHYKNVPPEHNPIGVFWEYAHRWHDLEYLLNGLRRVVANIRAGDVHIHPSDTCRYCPGKGTESCLPLLKSVSDPETRRIVVRSLTVVPQ